MLTRLDRTIAELEDIVTKIQCLPESDQLQECPAVFNARFSRCYGLLSMTARRVLGGNEEWKRRCKTVGS
jgi:hypothetical protein